MARLLRTRVKLGIYEVEPHLLTDALLLRTRVKLGIYEVGQDGLGGCVGFGLVLNLVSTKCHEGL